MRRAEHIATVAARVFERLTGMPAAPRINSKTGAAYGPFLDFLKAVFEACGIAASAEAQAKAVRRKHRSKMALTPFETPIILCTLLTEKTAVRMSSDEVLLRFKISSSATSFAIGRPS